MSESNLQELSQKLNQLISRCEQLHGDKQLLQQREEGWLIERARLIEKNELARTRIEAMIVQLKNLREGVASDA